VDRGMDEREEGLVLIGFVGNFCFAVVMFEVLLSVFGFEFLFSEMLNQLAKER
jgi:hypothetical protein